MRLAVCLVAMTGAVAWAAGDEAARGHFLAGKAYFDRGDYGRALAEFREAARELDVPELDYNIARACDRLGDAACSADRYRRYLQRRPDAEDRDAVNARLADLEPRVGWIEVRSQVPGTIFQIDGEPLSTEGPRAITAGMHHVTASHDGYRRRTLDVTIVGRRSLRVDLDPEKVVTKSKAWIGVVVGGTLAVAAGVVLIALLAGGDSPYRGNFPPMLQTVP